MYLTPRFVFESFSTERSCPPLSHNPGKCNRNSFHALLYWIHSIYRLYLQLSCCTNFKEVLNIFFPVVLFLGLCCHLLFESLDDRVPFYSQQQEDLHYIQKHHTQLNIFTFQDILKVQCKQTIYFWIKHKPERNKYFFCTLKVEI